MDTKAAIARLDALEGEAKKLREIIESGNKVVYDSRKLYVGIYKGRPYIMVGYGPDKYFRFHAFSMYDRTEGGWSDPIYSGQRCIDYHVGVGFDIHVFDDTKEALQFFMEHL